MHTLRLWLFAKRHAIITGLVCLFVGAFANESANLSKEPFYVRAATAFSPALKVERSTGRSWELFGVNWIEVRPPTSEEIDHILRKGRRDMSELAATMEKYKAMADWAEYLQKYPPKPQP